MQPILHETLLGNCTFPNSLATKSPSAHHRHGSALQACVVAPSGATSLRRMRSPQAPEFACKLWVAARPSGCTTAYGLITRNACCRPCPNVPTNWVIPAGRYTPQCVFGCTCWRWLVSPLWWRATSSGDTNSRPALHECCQGTRAHPKRTWASASLTDVLVSVVSRLRLHTRYLVRCQACPG